MDLSVRAATAANENLDGLWMLVGKDGKITQAPFTVTDDVINLNSRDPGVAQISLPHNKGFAAHMHWLERYNDVPLIYPVYVFFQQPLGQLAPDRRLKDMSDSKTYPNVYGMYLA